jgi:hypothetical protein
MPVITSVHVYFQNGVTLGELREFVETAERIGAEADETVLQTDDNGTHTGLEAFGAISYDPAANSIS